MSRLELEVARAARDRGERPRFHFLVAGKSMLPNLHPGMRVVVEVVSAGDLKGGDLVCWYCGDSRDGQKVIHRFVRATSEAIVTRGDALNYDDPPVPVDDVIGRVIDWARPTCWYRLRRVARRAMASAFKVTSLATAPFVASAILPRVMIEVVRIESQRPDVEEPPIGIQGRARLWRNPIGHASLLRRDEWGEGVCELLGVGTSRWMRNMGVARMLCRQVVDRSEILGARRVVILASVADRSTLRVYRNVGFVRSQDAQLERRLTANDPAGMRRVLLELPVAGVMAPRGSCPE